MTDDLSRYIRIIDAVLRNQPLWHRIVAHKMLRKTRPPTEHDIEYLGDLFAFVITVDPTFEGTEYTRLLQMINSLNERWTNREGPDKLFPCEVIPAPRGEARRLLDRFFAEQPEFLDEIRARLRDKQELGDLMLTFFSKVESYGFDSTTYSAPDLFGDVLKVAEGKGLPV